MKSRNVLALLASSLAGAVVVNAQSVVPPPREEAVILSPFEVRTERDTGFVAASSLAGGRLTTELKDTPVAYSVITSDFIEALGVIDVEEAMAWQVGSYAPLADNVNYKLFNNESGSAVISRGVQVSSQQRNFFFLGINSDAYSQERVDFARGPNALLIGTSGLGGQVITMTKQARTDKAFGKVSLLGGSEDRFRTTIDLNQPIGSKLAVRTNLLWQDSKTWRSLGLDNRRGAHFAATYKPFRRTKLRADYETYKQDTLVARESLTDRVSGWDGVSTVPIATSSITGADARGLARNGSSTAPYLVYIPGTDGGTIMNWANTWKTLGGAATSATPVGGVLPLSSSNLGINGASILENAYDQNSLFRLAESGSAFRRPSRAFVNLPNFPNRRYDFQVATVFLEHQQGDHYFLEAAYTHANTENISEYLASRGTMGEALIDVNQTLPNGQPNPNFKQVYGEGHSAHNHNVDTIDAYRVALAAVYDGTRWGDFRASLMLGGTHNPSPTTRYTEALDRTADIRTRARNDIFMYRYYWNDPTRPFTIPTEVSLVDPIAGTVRNHKVDRVIDMTSANHRNVESKFRYLQATLTAKILKGRVNLIAGARRDSVEANTFTVNSLVANGADFPVDWDGRTVHYRPLAPADYSKLTYQVKDAAGNITGNGAFVPALARPRDNTGRRLPQYANDRFQDDYSAPTYKENVTTVSYGGVFHALKWASVYYNFAETFAPPSNGVTITGAPMQSSKSEGWDGGVRFTLLNGKISASFGTYQSTQFGAGYDSSGRVGKYRNIVSANVVGDSSINGFNARGLPPVNAFTFDFRDRTSRGKEIDIVANLTNNWRLSANASFPEVARTNEDQDQWKYLRANEATLRQVVLDAGVLIDANNVATVDTSIPVSQRSPDASAAANGWNDIQDFKRTNDPAAAVASDLPDFTANIYTDYRFNRGFLKGLRAGAGVQYIGKRNIGNRGSDTIVDPANPTRAIDDPNVDSTTRISRPGYYTVRANFSYDYRLKKDRRLTLSLNIRNVLDNTDPTFTGTGLRAPGGDIRRPDRVAVPTGFIFRQPRSFEFSTSLAF